MYEDIYGHLSLSVAAITKTLTTSGDVSFYPQELCSAQKVPLLTITNSFEHNVMDITSVVNLACMSNTSSVML